MDHVVRDEVQFRFPKFGDVAVSDVGFGLLGLGALGETVYQGLADKVGVLGVALGVGGVQAFQQEPFGSFVLGIFFPEGQLRRLFVGGEGYELVFGSGLDFRIGVKLFDFFPGLLVGLAQGGLAESLLVKGVRLRSGSLFILAHRFFEDGQGEGITLLLESFVGFSELFLKGPSGGAEYGDRTGDAQKHDDQKNFFHFLPFRDYLAFLLSLGAGPSPLVFFSFLAFFCCSSMSEATESVVRG